MAYVIGQDQEIGKQNRKKLDNTTYHYLVPSTPSYSYDRLNENTESNTTVILPPHFDTSIPPQQNSAYDASVGENYVSSD